MEDMKYYYKFLAMYSDLSQKEKDKIFFAVLKNEQRCLDKKSVIEQEVWSLINIYGVDNVTLLKEEIEKLLNKNNYVFELKDIDCENVIDIVLKEIDNICNTIKKRKIGAIALSLFMDKNDILPLVWYAFDRSFFKEHIKEKELISVIQLSISYLYRLIEVNIDTKGLGKEGGSGAYCKILVAHNKLYKVPLNYAALFYANFNEWNVYKKLCHTRLFKYMPRYFDYYSELGIIEKEYIHGDTGEQILLRRGELLDEEKQGLREVYYIISEVCLEKDVLLDIHPNNFVWNETDRQWYLIDLGENQYIGSDYYIMDDFEKYYKKSWIERKMRKEIYPIRSVLL